MGGWLGGWIRGMDERMVGVPVVAAGSHLHLVDSPRPGIFNTQICLLKVNLSKLPNDKEAATVGILNVKCPRLSNILMHASSNWTVNIPFVAKNIQNAVLPKGRVIALLVFIMCLKG